MANVTAQRIARIYAEALVGAAEKKGKEGEVLDDLAVLVREVFARQPQAEEFLGSSSVSRHVKDDVINKVFGEKGGKGAKLFTDFLHVLNHHGRLDLLREILGAVESIRNDKLRRIRVRVRSAVPLTEDVRKRLVQQLHDTFKLEPELEEQQDPELLGGMIVRVGDWVFDGSVRTRVESLRKLLLERSNHEIQSGRDRFSTAS